MTESGSPRVGSLVGGTYRLLTLIDGGGAGDVYEAAHARLPGRFVVKPLGPHVANPVVLARVRTCLGKLAALGHPHLVQYVDLDVGPDGVPYVVMERVEGRTLREVHLVEGPLSPTRVARVVRQAASALEAAAHVGVHPEDLRPERIMLVSAEGADDFVKVLDFGVGRLQVSGHEPGWSPRAPASEAPERDMGTPANARTTVFALGAIAYLLLAGKEPFGEGGDDERAARRRARGEPLPLPRRRARVGGLGVEAVLRRALDRRPAQRFATPMAFAAALARALTAAPRRRSPGRRAQPPLALPAAAEEIRTDILTPAAMSTRADLARRRRLGGAARAAVLLVLVSTSALFASTALLGRAPLEHVLETAGRALASWRGRAPPSPEASAKEDERP